MFYDNDAVVADDQARALMKEPFCELDGPINRLQSSASLRAS